MLRKTHPHRSPSFSGIYDYNLWLEEKYDEHQLTGYTQRLTIYPVNFGSGDYTTTDSTTFLGIDLAELTIEEVETGEHYDEWWCESDQIEESNIPEWIRAKIDEITQRFIDGECSCCHKRELP